jgi:hypothetical protein
MSDEIARAGEWRDDPAGQHDHRYWDGEKWTENVSDNGVVSNDPYDGTIAPRPPVHLGAANRQQPLAPPHQQPPTVIVQHKSRGCLWAALIVVGLVILGIVIFALAVNKAVDDLNAEQQKHAITKAQFDAVQLGITHAALEQQLGKTPEDTQEFVHKGILDEADINSSCVYYNEDGETFGSRFQFCFNGDALDSKNAY